MARLADAAVDLRVVLDQHGYADAIIFGHAKDGNLHFVITQGFTHAAEMLRYRDFMDDVVRLVVEKYDGALKAEHGTGRNMAPFVETEWGGEAYAIMQQIKALADPHGLLNPGVILNANPEAHVSDLKNLPVVEAEVDKCIECGYCEPKCPSRDLTLTPRQRIVVRREMQRLKDAGRRRGAIRGAGSRLPVHGAGYLRGRWAVRFECPVRHRHRQAHEALSPDLDTLRLRTTWRWPHGANSEADGSGARGFRSPRGISCSGSSDFPPWWGLREF